eukprot:TRINITY_DN1436_c0_g1_i2.p1 TRINITY_DN1436_c0_g1~~TRINITY_DN1436_c0_g1_i2.p1  ORF type:complete len:203 (-),score=4.89 TRINITY_DN1436_c0_g1_i2:61-669(-)
MNPFDDQQPLNQPAFGVQQDLRQQTTLDEPIWSTLWRDIKRIGIKLFHVLIPRGGSEKALRDWDLWGPLVFCLMLAVLLSQLAVPLFVIVWVGAAVVTLNSLLLGGKISFFQCVCVLGYCVFPLVVGALVAWAAHLKWPNVWFRIGVSLGCFLWSTWASVGFLAGMIPPDRRLLAVYPICLFYLVLAWMIIVNFTPVSVNVN